MKEEIVKLEKERKEKKRKDSIYHDIVKDKDEEIGKDIGKELDEEEKKRRRKGKWRRRNRYYCHLYQKSKKKKDRENKSKNNFIKRERKQS